MKDIVANRGRLTTGTKLQLMGLSLKENGVLWTAAMGFYYLSSAVAEKSFSAADGMRKRRGLPGMNSPAMNRAIWNSWDWSAKGEEWSPSPEWKASVIARIMRPNIPKGGTVLEIGPGGGRWTEELAAGAKHLTGIDISEAAVENCRRRFAGLGNVSFSVGSGTDLAGVADASMDAVWSFDVFVHINRDQFRAYVKEIARALKPGGACVIQHGTTGGATGGWRSNVTAEDVKRYVAEAGLILVDQFTSWQDGGHEFPAGLYNDAVTIFRKG